jgi:hypothetical protein
MDAGFDETAHLLRYQQTDSRFVKWSFTMVVRVKKIHPALKHGGYAATGLLPGEDRAAFEKFHQDLIAELHPEGPLESDTVLLFRPRAFALPQRLQSSRLDRTFPKAYR